MIIQVRTWPTAGRSLVRHSLVPVLLASVSSIACHSARAQVQITGAQTTTVFTATAKNGSASDVTVTSTGSIAPASATGATAVIINSSNNFENDGTITIDNSNPSYGVLANGANNANITGNITNTGTVSVTDSSPATTLSTDSNGVGQLTGGYSRFGILVQGGTLTGAIANSGTITVLGNNSAGIAVESGLASDATHNGNIAISGTVNVTGNDSYGLQTGTLSSASTDTITNNLVVAGTGAVAGGVSITGTVTAFGRGSSAVLLGGSVGGQFYIDGTVTANAYYNGAQVTSRPNPYPNPALSSIHLQQSGPAVLVENKVGGGVVIDTSGVVTSYGSAPAIEIAPLSGGSAAISNNSGYGFVNNGSITANGIYDGFAATAMQVGANTGASGTIGAATITGTSGGVQNAGTISATSYGANATGVSFQTGATGITLNNSGTIKATVNFANDGKTGGTATAITDSVGALTSITNTGTITATSAAGSTVALNFTGSTTGVTVIQSASGTTTASSITGDIIFGNGNNTFNLDAGTLSGNVSFGSGANAFNISNGVTTTGAITQSAGGGTLALDITSGRLVNTSPTNLNLSTLGIGSSGELDFAVDPANSRNGSAVVGSVVSISNGAKIGLDFNSKLTSAETLTVLNTQPGALAGQSVTLGDIPYFYVGNLIINNNDQIQVALRNRTFAESGVPGNAAAYNAIFNAFDRDPGILNTFDNAANQQQFKAVYKQMLPAYSGGLFELLSEGSDALVQAQADKALALRGDHGGSWFQALGFGATQNNSASPGYYGGGAGVAFGWEEPASPISTIGFSVAYMRGAITQSEAGPNDQQTGTIYEGGVYWRETDGQFHANASLNAGIAELNGQRNFSGVDATDTAFTRRASSSWTGGMGQAHLGVDYEQALGNDYYVKPGVTGDYFVLYEGGHSDHNGGAGFDLKYGSSVGKQGSVVGAVTFGTRFNDEGFIWQPELTVGWKQVFGGPDNVLAQFISGGPSFSLTPPSQRGGPIAKIGIHGGDKYTDIAFQLGAEDRGPYRAFNGALVARFRF